MFESDNCAAPHEVQNPGQGISLLSLLELDKKGAPAHGDMSPSPASPGSILHNLPRESEGNDNLPAAQGAGQAGHALPETSFPVTEKSTPDEKVLGKELTERKETSLSEFAKQLNDGKISDELADAFVNAAAKGGLKAIKELKDQLNAELKKQGSEKRVFEQTAIDLATGAGETHILVGKPGGKADDGIVLPCELRRK